MKNNNINRKEALKKIGKYSALTAVGTLLVLNPLKAQSGSPFAPPGGRPAPSNDPTSILDD